MRVLIAALAGLMVNSLGAQTAPESSPMLQTRGQGHAYFGFANGPGDVTSSMTLGGGGEGFLHGGLAAGGDVAYLYAKEAFGYGIGLASANLSYHFREIDPEGRWVPFVTGGYSLAFRGGAASLANYGGGVTYWFRPHWGARVEFRNYQNAGTSIPSFRFGFSFR